MLQQRIRLASRAYKKASVEVISLLFLVRRIQTYRIQAHNPCIMALAQLSAPMIFIVLYFLLVSIATAQDVATLPQGFRVVESSPIRLVVEYAPHLQGFDTLIVQGSTTLQPRIHRATAAGNKAGAPVWMQVQLPVSVPSATGFRIAEVNVHGVRSIAAIMSPHPMTMRPKSSRFGSPYYIDENFYHNTASTVMPHWAEMQYGGIGRTKHIATLIMRAARYNPASHSIEIPHHIRIVIEFDMPNTLPSLSGSSEKEHLVQTLNDRASVAWGDANSDANNSTIATSPANSPLPSSNPFKRTSETQAAEGRWVRIGVEREGMYRVTAQQLRDAGITISAQEISSLRLYGNGGAELSERVSDAEKNVMNEQAILTETDASGNFSAFVFYGAAPNGFVYRNGTIQHFVNTFSTRNYYLLNIGAAGQGQRATFTESPQNAAFAPTHYIERVFRNDDILNPFDVSGDGSGRRWLGDRLSSGSVLRYETQMPNLVTNAEPIFYRVSAAWNSPRNIGNGGEIFVRESGQNLFATPFRFQGAVYDYEVGEVRTQSASLSATSIRNNRSTLEFLYESSSPSGDNYGVVDWYEIHYPRAFVAINNQLSFFAEPFNSRFGVAEYTISGFTSGEQVYIIDVTNRAAPQFIRNLSTNRLVANFRAMVDNIAEPRRFYLSSQTLAPVSIESTEFAGLRSTPLYAELIVVTDKELKSSADAYRTYRESTGLKTLVVTTEQLYNEFNGGTPDPTAIRDFLSFAFRTWSPKPRYVLFWGDGHFDYRSLDPTNKPKSFVPTYQMYDPDGYMNSVNTNYMTEDYFVQIVGNDPIVDMALGRLCVRSNEEGNTMLSKIRQYETSSSLDDWRTSITLIADDGPTTSTARGFSDYSLHVNQSESLANTIIPDDIRARKIYMPDYPTENVPGGRRRPGVTDEMIAAVNEGTLILNWIGHGNPKLWAHENILIKDIHVPKFTNRDRLFFLVAATCDFARFDNLREQSGAEDMISSPHGGAIGVFAAARTVYSLDNAAISQRLYSEIFRTVDGVTVTPSIGDAFFRVKQVFYSGSFYNDLKFCLLGDPTIRLALPSQRIVVETLNGAQLRDSSAPTPQIKALSTVSISGFVAMGTDVTRADTGYTGNILCNLYDSDIQRTAIDVDEDRTIHRFTMLGGLLNIGAAEVKNGRFNLHFVVPKDISFSNKQGRMFLYAVNNTNSKFGRGSTTQFTIGDVDETAVNDGAGPEIRIYMDTRSFRAGDIVDSTPRLIADLYDATGINASGAGIGHDIQCWIDDNPIPINLTRSFRVSLADPRRGEVNRVLSKLTPGRHRVRVRAWDVFNNFSEAETYFRVGAESGLIVSDVMNYPNPFDASTTIYFRHNQLMAQPYRIVIASIAGNVVRTFSGNTDARTMEIVWDGRNDNGIPVANGTYIYRIEISGQDGAQRSIGGQMLLRR